MPYDRIYFRTIVNSGLDNSANPPGLYVSDASELLASATFWTKHGCSIRAKILTVDTNTIYCTAKNGQ